MTAQALLFEDIALQQSGIAFGNVVETATISLYDTIRPLSLPRRDDVQPRLENPESGKVEFAFALLASGHDPRARLQLERETPAAHVEHCRRDVSACRADSTQSALQTGRGKPVVFAPLHSCDRLRPRHAVRTRIG